MPSVYPLLAAIFDMMPLFAQDDAAGAIGGLLGCVCMLLVVVPTFGFWIWMLIDVITKEPAGGDQKLMWILIVVLLGFIGALVYYFVRRPKRIAEHGQ
jgi:hypothetical protein